MYSVQIQVSDGTLSVINVSIEYFAREDITLYKNLGTTPLVLGTDWEWDTDTRINLLTSVPVPEDEYITVRRNTNKDRAYNIYDGNAPFSRETLDENFKQMIYLAQEFTEGNGLTGLFFPLDMNGFQIHNLGKGTAAADAVNKGQLDVVDNRVSSLENAVDTTSTSYPWYTIVTGTAQDTFTPPVPFVKASVYLDGICQVPDYSFVVVDDKIMLAEAVPVGTVVFARLGEEFENASDVATAEALMQVRAELLARIELLEEEYDNLGPRVTTAESDIDALQTGQTTLQSRASALELRATNLETRMTIEENAVQSVALGGTGGTTAAQARTNLGAAPVASPTFTGIPAAPTASAGTNTTQLATTAFVTSAITAADTGVVNGSNAAAGRVGEYVEALGTAGITLANGTVTNMVSLTLGAGDWEIDGMIATDTTNAAYASVVSGISTTATTIPTFPNRWQLAVGLTAIAQHFPVPKRRVSITASTTYYLTLSVGFTSGSCTGQGFIRARRIR